LREQNRGNREAIRTAEKDMENSMRGQIQAMLLTDQLEKFAAIKETIRLPRPGQDERIKEMNERLKLTDVQSAQIAEIMMATQTKIDSLREQASDNWEAGHSAMQKIREDTDQKIENLLTAEQKKEYQKMKDERSKRRPGPPPGMGRDQHRF
jgi:periplasmic protein CpxP/Spy